MAAKTWTGGTGDYSAPANWSDGAVPVKYDQAYIPGGTVQAGAITIEAGTQLRIVNSDFSLPVTLQFTGTTIAGNTSAGTHTDTTVADNQIVALGGTVTLSGVISTFLTYGTLRVTDLAAAATLVLPPVPLLSAYGGTLDLSVTNLVNNSSINGTDAHISSTNISGTGVFGVGSTLLFDHAVPAGLSVLFGTAPGGTPAELELADPGGFAATIKLFNYTSNIQLRGVQADAATWSDGTLSVTNGGSPVAALNVAGYFPHGFKVDHLDPAGNNDPANSYIHGLGLHAAVTKTWNGGAGDFTAGANWSDGVAPDPGDTGIVVNGTLNVDHATIGPLTTIKMSNGDYTTPVHVVFTDATIGGGFLANGAKSPSQGDSESYEFAGTSTLSGLIAGSQPYGVIDIKDASSTPASLIVTRDGQISSTYADLNIAVSTLDLEGKALLLGAFGYVSSSTITGTGTFLIGTTSTFSFDHGVGSGITVSFNGNGTKAGAMLELSDPAHFEATIAGFAPGYLIDLNNILADRATFSGGVLKVTLAGAPVASLHMTGDFTHGFTVNDINGFGFPEPGSSFIHANVACFAAGTRIATARGDVAVEDLRPGDRAALPRSGGFAPIVWIGHRRIDVRRHPRPHDVAPIRVLAGAFGPACPARDLLLSPDHAVFADGVLIPIRYLLNGATVRQEAVPLVTYYHIELDRHDVVLAEGLPAESFLDTGNRAAFANGGAALHLHADFALQVWAAQACAPLVRGGARLVAVRSALLAQAAGLGGTLTDEPALSVLADDRPVPLTCSGGMWQALLPEDAREVRVLSRRWVPAHTRPDEHDTRQLGVAIAQLWLDGRAVSLDSPALHTGWHTPEPGWRWTGGDAAFAVAGVRDVRFMLALTGTYWRDEGGLNRAVA